MHQIYVEFTRSLANCLLCFKWRVTSRIGYFYITRWNLYNQNQGGAPCQVK